MHGWCGAILHIDLSEQKCWTQSPEPEIFQTFIGGRGLAGHYLAPHVKEDCNNPNMPILFMTGPLVGTQAPTSGRMCIMSRSPLTGTIGDTSVGGNFGTDLKKAGWDGIIITGQSEQLCGIEIQDQTVTIVTAESYRGQDTHRVVQSLKEKGSIACIGPAAENGVLFANIMIDGSFAAGRNGLGSVLANKNLKYIAVKSSGQVAVAHPDALKQAREDIRRLISASPILLGKHGITHYGTGALYDIIDSRLIMPTANFRRTRFEYADSMNAHAYKEKYTPKRTGCRGCHILCKKVSEKGEHIPEFETMSHFSALLENTDIDVVMQANQLCNKVGMDTITAGATLSCYAEINHEKLTGARILQLLEDISKNQGEGKELTQGSYRYAKKQDQPEVSVSVKQQELPAYDPRGAFGMALAYATSTRGACHLRAYPISHELLRKPVATDRFTGEGKARIIKISEDINAVVDSLTACKFVFFACSLEEYAKAYTAVTGIKTTAQDLLNSGERIIYQERIMNAANGFTAEDDDLPPRFFNEPGSKAKDFEIPALDREEFLQTRTNYYKIRGLDKNGRPIKEKAASLSLRPTVNREP